MVGSLPLERRGRGIPTRRKSSVQSLVAQESGGRASVVMGWGGDGGRLVGKRTPEVGPNWGEY